MGGRMPLNTDERIALLAGFKSLWYALRVRRQPFRGRLRNRNATNRVRRLNSFYR